MLFKRRLIIALIVLLLIFLVVLACAFSQASKHVQRDPVVLMNTYFKFKESNAHAARKALDIILEQDPGYVPALAELSQWLIQEERFEDALPVLQRLSHEQPDEKKYVFQLAYLHYQMGEWDLAKVYFLSLISNQNSTWKARVDSALSAMNSFIPSYKDWAHARFFYRAWSDDNPVESDLNTYYGLRVHDKKAAHVYLDIIKAKHPNNVSILREAGTFAIEEKRVDAALDMFMRIYALTGEAETAMQIGYLYSALNENKKAYTFFDRATHTQNKELSFLANDAMTRLAGQQTKAMSKPYYGEFYFMPFTQSRFGITVSQFIGRLGLEFDLPLAPRVYSFTRRTQDNRENNSGELTQLYEDNVWVTGVGGQVFPFRNLPLFIYVEGGAARDLFYRARERWRPDLRAGFMYYQETGARPSYYAEPKYSRDYYSIWYAEMTYFSRYDNNVIASIRTHQGIRLFQYKSSMINLFVRGRVIEDTRRDFYNNFAELGPGLGIIPSNRYNVEIHLDYINGMYLPAGGRQRNPFAKYYSNRRALLLCYVKV